jgi:hypothetical protein
MTKITLNPKLPLPISETIHELLEACGYSLAQQAPLHLEYEKGCKRLSFIGQVVAYEIVCDAEGDRPEGLEPLFCMQILMIMTDMQLAMVLQILGVIDFSSLKEFTATISNDHGESTFNDGRNTVGIGALYPGGNVGFFGPRVVKGQVLETTTAA